MKRIVVKIGSSSLIAADGSLCQKKIDSFVEQISSLQSSGKYQIALVSSGAIAAGLGILGWSRHHITMPEKQAAAAVGQGLLTDMYQKLFARQNILTAQILLNRSDIEDRRRFIHIRNTMETLLRNGILPIVNENDSVTVEEIRFGDNDTLSSLVALIIEADLLILLTDIDGLYTGHPHKDPTAKRIPEVWKITPEIEKLAGNPGSPVGTGGMRTKLIAARMATHSGIDVVIASSSEKDVLKRIMNGEKIGTRFYAQQRMPSKKSWIAYGSKAEGRLYIDSGAINALTHQRRSLLIAGIIEVEGDFDEGAIVEIRSPSNQMVGKGVVSFSAQDLRLLLKRKQQGEKLHNYHEVIHRDSLVILVLDENANYINQS
ncbi:glutamate 5-kinase [Thermoflavimicrobium dichotomicum]|uniref:Glutamate 5-kinase n=1 Tax=Thermoflavimicrobium dichotomicum TaxID=46223 RepID=A0A1I3VE44_9BACL|nr:glutamate 5-kinase [Thermoflavimicrobium dichotomicum]SFJ93452.1 glutamate 5-kinase [Thermoflavimicrobium dichotomicum]